MSAQDSDARPTASLREGEYTVAGPLALRADRLYRPGETVTLDADEGAALVKAGILAPPDSAVAPEGARNNGAPEGAEKDAAIRAAIEALDPADESAWTKAGAPATDALEAALGFKVSAAERDAAWAAIEDS